MSNVKMCNSCDTIFAEGVPGSTVGSETDPETGRLVALDWCPDCSAKRKEQRAGQIWRKSDPEAKAIES